MFLNVLAQEIGDFAQKLGYGPNPDLAVYLAQYFGGLGWDPLECKITVVDCYLAEMD